MQQTEKIKRFIKKAAAKLKRKMKKVKAAKTAKGLVHFLHKTEVYIKRLQTALFTCSPPKVRRPSLLLFTQQCIYIVQLYCHTTSPMVIRWSFWQPWPHSIISESSNPILQSPNQYHQCNVNTLITWRSNFVRNSLIQSKSPNNS